VTGLMPASFKVERFEPAGEACLEVRGRWFGVRGRRFMRPALTAVADGHAQRSLAVLDHKPWTAEEGEAWLAVFPWSSDPAALLEAELTVAPNVTVPLPPPSPAPGRRRTGSRGSTTSRAQPTREAARPNPRPAKDPGVPDNRMHAEHAAALRSRDEALAEREAAKRDCDRLRKDLKQALAACDAAIAERHDAIEAEVGLRIAAVAERDAARRERNRMLAQRDTARTRFQEVTRQWELAAALGTRRTQERDAAASERDRLVRERDGALEQQELAIRERDGALEQREPAIHQRDPPLQDVTVPQPPEPRRRALAIAQSVGTRDPEAVWRARLLAGAALLVVVVVLIVLLAS
jgi:hypothetical protein